MWLIDFTTLVLILLGATYLGVVGLFGFDVFDYFPGWRYIAYDIIGFAAVWQWSRQRFA